MTSSRPWRVVLAVTVGAVVVSACGALPSEERLFGEMPNPVDGAAFSAEGLAPIEAACSVSSPDSFDLSYVDGPDLTPDEMVDTPQGRALDAVLGGGSGEGGEYREADGFSIVSDDYVLGYKDGQLFSEFFFDGDDVRGWGGCQLVLGRDGQTASRWRPAGPLDPAATTIPILVEGGACVEEDGTRIVTEIVEIRVQDEDAVLVTAWTRNVDMPEMCAGVGVDLAAEAVLDLPLGDRELLDGGLIPPAPIEVVATTAEVTTTTPVDGASAAVPDDLFTRCGDATFPLGTTDLAGEPLDESASHALEVLADLGEGAPFAENYDWTIVSLEGDEIVLIGAASDTSQWDGHAYAQFEFVDDGWDPHGWGTCWPETFTTRPGYATGHWVLDPGVESDPESSVINVLVMERSCANGEPPEGRDIVPIVETHGDSMTITVLVEHVKGMATCPGNPWYSTMLDVGEPIGDRVLIDGRVRPGLERPWPPTETSLDSGGDDA